MFWQASARVFPDSESGLAVDVVRVDSLAAAAPAHDVIHGAGVLHSHLARHAPSVGRAPRSQVNRKPRSFLRSDPARPRDDPSRVGAYKLNSGPATANAIMNATMGGRIRHGVVDELTQPASPYPS